MFGESFVAGRSYPRRRWGSRSAADPALWDTVTHRAAFLADTSR
jgi:hypothetical protein